MQRVLIADLGEQINLSIKTNGTGKTESDFLFPHFGRPRVRPMLRNRLMAD